MNTIRKKLIGSVGKTVAFALSLVMGLAGFAGHAQVPATSWGKEAGNAQNSRLSVGSGALPTLRWFNAAATGDPLIGPDGTVYAYDALKLAAFNGSTGSNEWSYSFINSDGIVLPALSESGSFFGAVASGQNVNLFSLNVTNGGLNWTVPGPKMNDLPAALGADGSLILTTSLDNGTTNYTFSTNPKTGAMNWQSPNIYGYQISPAIGADGTIYLQNTNSVVEALDPTNGNLKWSYKIPNPNQQDSEYYSSPVYGPDGTLYVTVMTGINGGTIYALDSTTGSVLWSFTNPYLWSGVSLGPNHTAYLELMDANHVTSFQPSLCALDTLSGDEIWTVQTSADFITFPVVAADSTVYIATVPTTINAFNGVTGANVWNYSIPASVTLFSNQNGLAIASDGALCVGTHTGMYCLDSIHIASFSISPTAVLGGVSSVGTITLSAPAPSGGSLITFSESSTVAGLPASVIVPAGQTSVTFPISTTVVSAKTVVQIQAFPGIQQTASLTVNPPALTGLSISPASIVGGSGSTGTVTLGTPAGPSGLVISLASGNAAATLPSTVTVASGQTSATFSVATSAVDSVTPAVITATFGSNAFSQTLTINPSALISVVLNPTSVQGGASSTGTITLSGPAGPSGAVVALSSSSSSATLPGSVTIPVGQTSATFTVATTPVSAQVQAVITGNLNKVPQTATLTINPATLVSLTLSPTSVLGGNTSTGTVTLSGAAPTGGTSVALSSGNAAATVPSSVTVPAGQTTATFTVTTSGVNTQTSAVITATLNNKPQTATLTITPGALFSILLSPASVQGGTPSTGTVTLSGPAGSGGTTIALSSNTPAATLPTSVTIPSGQTSATFKVTSLGVNAQTTAIISGSLNGTSQTANLTITPVGIQSFSLSPTTVFGGNASTGTITLNGPAGIGGSTVTLGSSSSSVTPPGSLTIPQGQMSASFQVQTSAVNSTVAATLTANLNGTTSSALLTVTAPVLQSLTVSPSTLAGSGTATGTVTFSGVAPASGITVSLLSSSFSATVPSSVKVPAGQSAVSFSISASSVTATTTVTISATANFVSKSATLTLNPIQLMSLTLDPSTVNGGASSTGTVSLNGPAGKGGLVVHLKSSLVGVTIPATLPIAAGQSSATFKVTTVGVSTQKVATITATLGSVSETATLTVNPPVLSGISLNPSTVTGSLSSTGTVTLSGSAPSSGMVVKLSSSSSNATLPVSVTIPSGKSTAIFTVKTLAVPTQTTASISGSLNGVTESATLTINPPSILTFLLLPASVKGGSTSTGRITLNAVAPKGGLVISLSAGQSDATVPTTLTIAAGRTTGTFTIKTGKVTAKTIATISAIATGASRTAVLTITP